MKKEEIEKLSQLALIELSEEEKEPALKNLEKILNAFQKLEALETKGVDPLYHFKGEMPLVEDKAEKALDRDLLLANSPDQADDSFRLPQVVGGDEY